MKEAVAVLVDEFCQRRKANKYYSIRAFARDLKTSSGAISQILSGKRPLTSKMALKIADQIDLDLKKREILLRAVKSRRSQEAGKEDYHYLDNDTFAVVSDWYHYAILNLAKTAHFSSDHRQIAKRLNISSTEARAAIQRLIKLKLLEETDEGELRRTFAKLSSQSGIPSAAVKSFHKQSLNKAIDAIDSLNVSERDFGSAMFVMDPHRIDEAKKMLDEFRLQFSHNFEEPGGDAVFQLNTQLIPLTVKPQ